MPRPYTYAGEYPTAHKNSTVYGISQRKKYMDDFRPTCKFKVQIRLKKFFLCRVYYVDTVGQNKKVIAEYIRNQLEEDYAADQKNLLNRLRVSRESRINSRT